MPTPTSKVTLPMFQDLSTMVTVGPDLVAPAVVRFQVTLETDDRTCVDVTAEYDDADGRYYVTRLEVSVGTPDKSTPKYRSVNANIVRNFPLAGPLQRAVAMASLQPLGDGRYGLLGPTEATKAAAIRATSQRARSKELERVAELYERGGVAAIAAGLPCSTRHAYRKLKKATEAGLIAGAD